MKKCIICLPLTLPSEVKLGFALTPFAISMIAQLSGLASVCCINLMGRRYLNMKRDEIESRVSSFQTIINRLGLNIDYYWSDNDIQHLRRIQSYCEKLFRLGELRSETRSLSVCHCGAVEVISEAIISDCTIEGKVLGVNDGVFFCKLCNTPLKNVQKPCLLLESNFQDLNIKVLPSFYKKEIAALQSFNQPLLVSRSRKRNHTVLLSGNTWQLDTDFCWSLLFCSLRDDGLDPATVIVSNHNLKQLVWALGISGKLSKQETDIEVVIMPYVSFGEPNSQLSRKGSVREMIDRYGRQPTRLLLGSALKWEQKEICINSNTIFWALKALSNDLTASSKTEEAPHSVSEIIRFMDGNLVDHLITSMRRADKSPVSRYHKLLLGER